MLWEQERIGECIHSFFEFSQTFTSDNVLMVSKTKFSIVIGFPCTYLSRNRRMTMGYQITGIQLQLFVIGYL